MVTRRAFFNSKMFFTVHGTPAYAGSALRHAIGFENWFRRTVISDGTSPGMLGSDPPNSTFSPAASRKLFVIAYGPGPFHPAIACESFPTSLKSERYESVI